VLQVTNRFSVEDMRRFAGEAWGELGVNVVEQWCRFNASYFGSVLRPVPLVITHAQPFGKRLAYCSYNPGTGAVKVCASRSRSPAKMFGLAAQ
jgi:hypothetical protein